ncbi:MAG: class I SAM-dependent methyltransferase [Alphaproteobacteria bacterium]|nr:class I SAM-dependent methyltransferase [Alphaproteobacteria bacterium]
MARARENGHPNGAEEVDFGFQRVPEREKAGLVREVFDNVAPRYDLMNDLMSLGVHRLWKDAMVAELAPQPGMQVLDVAGGTGDIALRVRPHVTRRPDQAANDPGRPVKDGVVYVSDINPEMLTHGRDRALDKGIVDGIVWLCGDAEALPLGDMTVDAVTIAFGIRNVTHLDRALSEARRVLRPGGRFLCLEFSRVSLPFVDQIYDRYSFSVLPALGRMVAGSEDAYRYLAESIRRFPPQEEFASMIAKAGFDRVRYRNLSAGVAALHGAWRF